jgi:exoribonuclease-2
MAWDKKIKAVRPSIIDGTERTSLDDPMFFLPSLQRYGILANEVNRMTVTEKQHRITLQRIARRTMIEKGLLPDFSAEVLLELDRLKAPTIANDGQVRDLRHCLWASIDNDDSLDLDQLTFAETTPGNTVRIFVAIADVDALVAHGSAIDGHARHNTTSVYTAAQIFPMLPEKLSTNLTSLNFGEDRLAIIIEMVIDADGSVKHSDVYRAWVRNYAKLAYNGVGAWLEGNGIMPEGIAAVPGLDENIRIQDKTAQRMKNFRHVHGALGFQTVEARPVFDGEEIRELSVASKNRATDIIEDFMIAANGATARYLSSRNFPSLRRVVKTPKRWARIVELAREHGFVLADTPDSRELERFLAQARAADPLRFPDLSLSIIKLLGPGEYVAELPGGAHTPGH